MTGQGINLEVGFDGTVFFTTQAVTNTLWTSTDGETWTDTGVDSYEHIAHREGRYVGVDGAGRRGWSNDLAGFAPVPQSSNAYWRVEALEPDAP